MRTWSDTPSGPARFRVYARPLIVASLPILFLLTAVIAIFLTSQSTHCN